MVQLRLHRLELRDDGRTPLWVDGRRSVEIASNWRRDQRWICIKTTSRRYLTDSKSNQDAESLHISPGLRGFERERTARSRTSRYRSRIVALRPALRGGRSAHGTKMTISRVATQTEDWKPPSRGSNGSGWIRHRPLTSQRIEQRAGETRPDCSPIADSRSRSLRPPSRPRSARPSLGRLSAPVFALKTSDASVPLAWTRGAGGDRRRHPSVRNRLALG